MIVHELAIHDSAANTISRTLHTTPLHAQENAAALLAQALLDDEMDESEGPFALSEWDNLGAGDYLTTSVDGEYRLYISLREVLRPARNEEEDGPRIWLGHWSETQKEGLMAVIAAEDVVAIVDEEEGGIIAYALSPYADRIREALNAYEESK